MWRNKHIKNWTSGHRPTKIRRAESVGKMKKINKKKKKKKRHMNNWIPADVYQGNTSGEFNPEHTPEHSLRSTCQHKHVRY